MGSIEKIFCQDCSTALGFLAEGAKDEEQSLDSVVVVTNGLLSVQAGRCRLEVELPALQQERTFLSSLLRPLHGVLKNLAAVELAIKETQSHHMIEWASNCIALEKAHAPRSKARNLAQVQETLAEAKPDDWTTVAFERGTLSASLNAVRHLWRQGRKAADGAQPPQVRLRTKAGKTALRYRLSARTEKGHMFETAKTCRHRDGGAGNIDAMIDADVLLFALGAEDTPGVDIRFFPKERLFFMEIDLRSPEGRAWATPIKARLGCSVTDGVVKPQLDRSEMGSSE